MVTVNIAKDFSRFPSGRYERNGDTSGEAFRSRFLADPISKGERVAVEFDGTLGYGSSFLEEAFGGLVRALRIKPAALLAQLELKSSDPSICDEVREYINDAGTKLGL